MPTAMKTMAGMGSSRGGLLTEVGAGFHGLEEAWRGTGGRGDKEGRGCRNTGITGLPGLVGREGSRPPYGGRESKKKV